MHSTSKLYLQRLFLPGCNLEASTATPEDIVVETEAARSDMMTSEVLKCGLRFWRTWVVVVVPLIALPILFQGQENEVKFLFIFPLNLAPRRRQNEKYRRAAIYYNSK